MPWTGDVFIRENPQFSGDTVWQQDQQATIKIIASRHDFHDQDIANGITQTLNINGLNTMLAALNFGGFKGINVDDPLANSDVASYAKCIAGGSFNADLLTLVLQDGSSLTPINIPTGGGGGSGTNLSHTPEASVVQINSDTGSNTIIAGATVNDAGVMTTDQVISLQNIISADYGLTTTRDQNSVTVVTQLGSNAVIGAATQSLAGVMTTTDKTKLDSIGAVVQIVSGSFTPNFVGATINSNGTAEWTRIGNMVTVYGTASWSSLTGGDPDDVRFDNLPFNILTAGRAAGLVGSVQNVNFGSDSLAGTDSTTTATFLSLEGSTGFKVVRLYVNWSLGSSDVAAGETIPMAYSLLGSSGFFGFSYTYQTADPFP